MSDNYFENEFENEFEEECKCGCGNHHGHSCCEDSCSSLASVLENKYVRIGLLAIGLLAVVGIIVCLTGRRNRYTF